MNGPGLYRILTQDGKGNISASTLALDPFELSFLIHCLEGLETLGDPRMKHLNLTGTVVLVEAAHPNS